jgi:hypothetical protein
LEKARFEPPVFFAGTLDRLLRVFSLLYAPKSPAKKISHLLLSDLARVAGYCVLWHGETAAHLAARALHQSLCRQ